MRYVCVLILLGFVFFSSPAQAGAVNFHVDLECSSCTSYSNLVLEIHDASKNNSARATATASGSVDFFGVPEGAYLLTVKTIHGDAIHQELVSVRAQSGPATIRLPESKTERPVTGTISVTRLKHKVPKEARKAFNKSVTLHERGDVEGSLEYLKKATEIDPEYMEAFNNLGARYLGLGQNDMALASFQRALELDPHASLVQINVAAAMMATGDLKGAENTLRRVAGSSDQIKAKYMLGLALYAQGQYTEEAADLLRRSQEDFPTARLALAAIYAKTGQEKQARQTLDTYMTTAPEAGRKQARAMLAGLQQHD